MPKENRERICNKENYLKKQRRKKKLSALKEAQAISRKHRNEIRNLLKTSFYDFRSLQGKNLLFVIKDTENMEKVILQKKPMGNGRVLLTLPVIDDVMIDNYVNTHRLEKPNDTSLTVSNDVEISELINYYYSINIGDVIDCPQGNMLVFRNCEVNKYSNKFIELNVRPYNLNKWYKNEFTSILGTRIFNGNKLKTFFQIEKDMSNMFIIQDTIVELLLYKSLMGKIHEDVALDFKTLGKRGMLSTGFYAILATDIGAVLRRFKNEENESEELDKPKVYTKRKGVDS